MSKLDLFFGKEAEPYNHPLLRFLDSDNFDRVEVDVVRQRDGLGFKAARIYLILTKQGAKQPPVEYAWDDELNEELVRRGIRAVSAEAESVRIGLALRNVFKRPETRFGDGFFNSVLVLVVREGGFSEYPMVAEVLKYVSTNPPHMGGHGYRDCRQMIEGIIVKRAGELVESLKYPQSEAKAILATAMARYLDERFSVSDQIRLGWLGPGSTRV